MTSPNYNFFLARDEAAPDGAASGVRNYDVTPDGKRFLMPRGEDPAMPRELAVIVNFDEEIRRAVPAR